MPYTTNTEQNMNDVCTIYIYIYICDERIMPKVQCTPRRSAVFCSVVVAVVAVRLFFSRFSFDSYSPLAHMFTALRCACRILCWCLMLVCCSTLLYVFFPVFILPVNGIYFVFFFLLASCTISYGYVIICLEYDTTASLAAVVTLRVVWCSCVCDKFRCPNTWISMRFNRNCGCVAFTQKQWLRYIHFSRAAIHWPSALALSPSFSREQIVNRQLEYIYR